MRNEILNLGASFDWMTPTWALLQDFANRPISRFGIQANVIFDRGDIRRLLKERGVKSWGYVYNVAGDLIMLSVPKSQAAWANWVLQEAGVPVLYGPPELMGKAKKRGVLSWLLGW